MTSEIQPTTGVCKFCECTDEQACEVGCAWADAEHTVCTLCNTAVTVAGSFLTVFNEVRFRERPQRLADRDVTWSALSPHHQRVLVMVTRAVCESWVETNLLQLSEEAIENLAAANELGLIAELLATKAPHELREGETVSQMVTRLLEPHLGTGLILPGR